MAQQGGLLRLVPNSELVARERQQDEAHAAQQRQAQPVIVGLAAHLMRLWQPAWLAKKPIEDDMLKSLRQRNGQYEADKLAEIQEQGGSAVYVMVTETKCRAAESWLRDILLEDGDIPFAVEAPKNPELPPDVEQRIHDRFAKKVMDSINSGTQIDPDLMDDLKEMAEQDIQDEIREEAEEACEKMEDKIDDRFKQGGMIEGFNAFISDLATYKNAFLKGPVVRNKARLSWVRGSDGTYQPQVTNELTPTYTRVDPYRCYPEPGITHIHEGYFFEHHRLSRPELAELIGLPGYDDGAIREVLANMSTGSMTNWLWSAEMQKAKLEEKHQIWLRPTEVCDALEFYGKVPGKYLLEWGMSPTDIPDPAKEYNVNAWMIGRWVIKATLNYDLLGKKPYKTTSFIKRPGAFWGVALPETIADIQQLCNGAARALSNNMGLASGPMVEINSDRLAEDEDITQIRPWLIIQTLSSPLGANDPAVRFTQPDDRSGPLMQVYQHFCKLADDQSGIPAYIYGDMQVGGAGRTASGLSMLMGSAGKGIRQVVMHIDLDIIEPAVTDQYNWEMRYGKDQSIKAPARIFAKGAVTLANREQLNVRRVEFLQATNNPTDQQIVGIDGRGEILREVAKGLSMPVNDIVPSREKLSSMQKQAQQGAPQGAGATPGGTPPAPVPTSPGGAPMGGAQANIVTNQQTGRT